MVNKKGRSTEAEIRRRLGLEGYARRAMRLARKAARRGLLDLAAIEDREKLTLEQQEMVSRDTAYFQTVLVVLDHRRHRRSGIAELEAALSLVASDRRGMN